MCNVDTHITSLRRPRKKILLQVITDFRDGSPARTTLLELAVGACELCCVFFCALNLLQQHSFFCSLSLHREMFSEAAWRSHRVSKLSFGYDLQLDSGFASLWHNCNTAVQGALWMYFFSQEYHIFSVS